MHQLQRVRLHAGHALLFVAVFLSVAAGPRDLLLRARQLYNQDQFDAAIMAAGQAAGQASQAGQAGQAAGVADAAALIAARARLERFRRGGDQADFDAARATLRSLDPAHLSPRDRVELIIGLGVSLYLEDRTGAAAEQFEIGLSQVSMLGPDSREPILDWWACALDRDAQQLRPSERRRLYSRILVRMEDELRRDNGSVVASYWLAAAARGVGDVERAWNAAIAAWVRAPSSAPWGVALRADLDRLVTEAIIPERARRVAPEGQFQETLDAMSADWSALKEKWTAR